MKKSHRAQIINEIETRIYEIWENPPSEIDNLKQTKHCGQSFTVVINAFHLILYLASTLWAIRQNAVSGVSIESLKTTSKSIINGYPKFLLESFGLRETAKLLYKTSEAIDRVSDVSDFIEIFDYLCPYLNKMHHWIDLLIPWYELSCTFQSMP